MRSVWLSTAVAAVLPTLTSAAYNISQTFPGQGSVNGSFSTPPSGVTRPEDYPHNPTYDPGDQLVLSWETDFDTVTLQLCQPTRSGRYAYVSLIENTKQTNFSWVVSGAVIGTENLIGDHMYYLQLTNSEGDGSFTSHFFNVTQPASETQVTTIAPGGTGTPSTAPSDNQPSAINTGSAGPTSGSGSSSNDDTSSGAGGSSSLSAGAIAGIVLGVIAAIAVLAAFIVWRVLATRRRRRRDVGIVSTNPATARPQEYYKPLVNEAPDASTGAPPYSTVEMHEADATPAPRPPQELPS